MSEKPEYLEVIGRMRRKSSGPGEDYDPPPDIFNCRKDGLGREIAQPLDRDRDIRAARWGTLRRDFEYTIALLKPSGLDPFQRNIFDALIFGQGNAVLFGASGSGKTTIALMALRNLCMQGKAVKAARMAQFKTRMEPSYCAEHQLSPDTVMEWFKEPEFLLLDELGYGEERREVTEHERRIFFDLVSIRDSTGKGTWISSNTELMQLKRLYGEAAFSRLDAAGNCVVGDFSKRPNYRYRK